MLLTFRVGGGPCTSGVHLLLTPNSSVEARQARASPGNLGLRCEGIVVTGARHRVPEPGEGLLEASRQALRWYRPVFNLSWHEAVLSEAPLDGVSEWLTARPRPQHVARDGFKAARKHRFEEETQTAWCSELNPTVSWAKCCLFGVQCWAPALQQQCCFPKQAFCARWVSSVSFSQLVRQVQPGTVPLQTHVFNLLDWCAAGRGLRVVLDVARRAAESTAGAADVPGCSAAGEDGADLPGARSVCGGPS